MKTIRLVIPHTGDPKAAQALADEALDLAADPHLIFTQLVGPEAGDGIAAKWARADLKCDYLWFLADDARIQTPDWDRIVVRAFQRFPDDCGLVHGDDGFWKDRLAVLPIISVDALRLIGHQWFPLYYRYRLDDHLHQVFDLAGRRLYLGTALRAETPGRNMSEDEIGRDAFMFRALEQVRFLQAASLRALKEHVVLR